MSKRCTREEIETILNLCNDDECPACRAIQQLIADQDRLCDLMTRTKECIELYYSGGIADEMGNLVKEIRG